MEHGINTAQPSAATKGKAEKSKGKKSSFERAKCKFLRLHFLPQIFLTFCHSTQIKNYSHGSLVASKTNQDARLIRVPSVAKTSLLRRNRPVPHDWRSLHNRSWALIPTPGEPSRVSGRGDFR